jgi:uncharacterized membrane protein YebE (DUF533 family)
MLNMQDLVGTLMQGVLAGSSQGRIAHALSGRGLSRPGGVFEQVLGGATSGTGTGTGGLLSGLGALASALVGGGRSATKEALGGGAMALLGSLALEALQGLRHPSTDDVSAAVPADLPLGLRPPANTDEESELESKARVILRAMINAAKADGQIDDAEQQRILGKLAEADVAATVQAFVRAEMGRPLDLKALLREVPNPQMAAEVYAASLLAIEVDTPAERDYLRQLAQGLGLDEGAVQRLHLTLGVI